jgi:hypothetical protein
MDADLQNRAVQLSNDLAALRARLAEAERGRDGWKHKADVADHEREYHRTIRDAAAGNWWVWQGDEDHLESLTCPVMIRPEQLQAMIAAARSQHDENCDTRDTMIPGKPCNCYLHWRERAESAESRLSAAAKALDLSVRAHDLHARIWDLPEIRRQAMALFDECGVDNWPAMFALATQLARAALKEARP